MKTNSDALVSLLSLQGAHWCLTSEWLTSRNFKFQTGPDRRQWSESLAFAPNGSIRGYANPNESGWRIEDGKLVVLRADGVPTCVATPCRQENGSILLAGDFLFGASGFQHYFEEVCPPTPLRDDEEKGLRSFDLFDTLIARRCFDPISIFRNIETKSGVVGFARSRQHVEGRLFRAGDYSFDDIYDALAKELDWSDAAKRALKTMELIEEWKNIFPIAQMVALVRPDDVIVSDMYLPLYFVRRLIDEKCGLSGRRLFLSNHGKHSGTIWSDVKALGAISRHFGDNQHGDVASPNSAGIAAEHIRVSSWSDGEKALLDLGYDEFAKCLREARLHTYDEDPQLHSAKMLQLEINIPLLIVASQYLLSFAQERDFDTLLMSARDCNLWVRLLQWIAVRTQAAPRVRYFISSRTLLLSHSHEYLIYFNNMRGRRSLIVDVSGTGRSPTHFIGKQNEQASTAVFLAVMTNSVAEWVANITDARDDVELEAFLTLDWHRRVRVEALNMAMEGSATGMIFNGHELEIEREPNEFGHVARRQIEAMGEAFGAFMDILGRSEIRDVFGVGSQADLQNAAAGLIERLCDHDFVLAPIMDDISASESEVIKRARAALIKNVAET